MKQREKLQPERSVRWSWIKVIMPWLLVAVLLVIPLYALAAAFAIRAGVFDLQDRTISDEETKALWAFVAAGLGTAVTLVGLLFTRSHNNRTLILQQEARDRQLLTEREAEERLILDTVISTLKLLALEDGKYAPRAQIAGSLVALVHLGHPIIAMRTLNVLWQEKAVDSDSAVWLISQVLETGSDRGRIEATNILRDNHAVLPAQRSGWYSWPEVLSENWLSDIPFYARANILIAAVEVVLSREQSWWVDGYEWVLSILDEALQHDPDEVIKNSAASLLLALFGVYKQSLDKNWAGRVHMKSVREVKKRASQRNVPGATCLELVYSLEERIAEWGARGSSP